MCDPHGVYFPDGTGRATIDIVIESGVLYLVVQDFLLGTTINLAAHMRPLHSV